MSPVADPLDQAQTDETYARGGALTPNDLRANLDLEPLPEDFAFANKSLAVALLEMQLGLRLGPAPVKSTEVLLERLLEIRREVQARAEQRGLPRAPAISGGGNGTSR